MSVFTPRAHPDRWSALHWSASPAFVGGLLLVLALLLFVFTASQFGIVIGGVALFGVFVLAIWLWPTLGLHTLIVAGAIHPFIMLLLFNLTGPGVVIKVVQAWKEVIVLIVLFKVIQQTLERRKAPQVTVVDALALLFLLYSGLYVLYPGSTDGDLSIVNRVFGWRADAFFLLAYFIGRGISISRGKLRAALVGFCVVSLVIAAIAPLQFMAPGVTNDLFASLGFNEYIEFQRGDDAVVFAVRQNAIPGLLIPRASSLLLSDLALAFYMLLAVPVTGALYILVRGLLPKLAANLLVLLNVAAALLTVTRTVILALVPLLLVLFFRPRGVWLGALLAVQLVVAGLAGLYGAGYSPKLLTEVFSVDSSVQGHFNALDDSIDILKHEPLGRGLGTAGQVAQRLATEGGTTNESWYFQLATEMGAPAMLLWLALGVALVVAALRRYAQVHDLWLKALCLGVACSMIGYLVASTTLHAWEGLATSIIFWLLAGFAISAPALDGAFARERQQGEAA